MTTSPTPFRVRGGAGSVSARLDDLDQAALVLAAAGADLGRCALTVIAVAADAGLVAAALADPIGVALLESACRQAVFGPRGLAPTAVGLELLAAALRAVTAAYRAGEAAAAAAVQQGELAVGRVLGVPIVIVGVEAAIAVAPAAMVVVRVRTARGLTAVPAPLSNAGQALLGELAAHPGLTEQVVATVPGAMGAWLDPLGVGGPPGVGGPLGSAGPQDMRAVAAAVAGLAAAAPPLREQPLHVEPGQPRSVPAARGLGDLMTTVADCPQSTVGVDAVVGADGRRAWVVSVPGTSTWSPSPGADPFDVTSDLHTLGGRPDAALGEVVAAMRAAGVPADEPVLLVGHSLGGMVAAQVAAQVATGPVTQREFQITHVITAGSPVALSGVSDDVHVLSIEHDHDLVPTLDGRPNPDRATWVTVTAPMATTRSGGGVAELTRGRLPLVTAHEATGYVATATQLEASTEPSVVAYQAELAPFLGGPGVTVTRTEVVGWRG